MLNDASEMYYHYNNHPFVSITLVGGGLFVGVNRQRIPLGGKTCGPATVAGGGAANP
jgi:hypothetical protein